MTKLMFVILAGAFVLSWAGTLVMRRVAFRLGMLDCPGGHKGHENATPLLGGVAIFWAILLPCLIGLLVAGVWKTYGAPNWLPASIQVHLGGIVARSIQALGILAAATGLHLMGLIDDRKHLGPWSKLLVQFGAAIFVVVFCNVRLLTLFGPTVSCTLSVLWLVALTNAFNFLDNMDGLTAGVGAIVAMAMFGAAAVMQQWFVMSLAALLAGSLLGFLPHNFNPARIFMGDAGSLAVGFLLAIISCLITYVKHDDSSIWYGALVPLFVMAVPIYDMFSVFYIRVSEGRNPMVGDRRHFSHRLLRRGMTVRRAVLTIYLCTAATALAGNVMAYVRGVMPSLLLSGLVLSILMIIALLESADASASSFDANDTK